MAKTTVTPIGNWSTYHDNGPFPTKSLLITTLQKNTGMSAIEKYNDATVEIRRLLQNCIDKKERFRAFGSAWSLCDIPHCSDQMHYNGNMNLKWTFQQSDLHAQSTLDAKNLFFFECGNTIKEVSNFMFSNGKSIKTTGASNGQTIAGAISTGIHGSAFDTGSVQDFVVGIQLIIGPGPNDVVYIESASKTGLSDKYIKTLNARVIRDDAMFNAALVSLGSFGFIHGVVIEAEDLFLLKRYTRLISRETALELASKLGNKPSDNFLTGTNIDAMENGAKPFHYKFYVNPYNKKDKYLMEIIYKKPYREDYPNPIPQIQTFIYKDLPEFMSILAAKFNRQIPLLMQALKSSIFPAADKDTEGRLAEIFYDTYHAGPAFGISLGIDYKQLEKGLDLFINIANTVGPVPGAMGIRFVKASKATLAFTKFPITCILEMDGITWKGNDHIVSLLEFETKLLEAFRANNIPFTLHWGKNSAWGIPGLVNNMYGAADDEWKVQRSKLLSKQMADIFSNDFLNRTKLSEYIRLLP
ncbi:FAD-linked oxidase [Taibaiella lutea]|uniref:FAD-linked oxidase n=1 Tax=Taibaiella lutea TaxID=2608001 RepID=A0A5M6CIA7_9BACT|nr:FAD-linked oxidase [Taibaiella lutea]KAA5534797.1 FAD-linked oxidase [Taibaiella lutea]